MEFRKMIILIIISVMFFEQSVAVIYSINETEYHRMPPLFATDDYEECMLQRGGTYCVADYDLSSKGHSDLMHFIREYSAHDIKHFNHTQIHRGTCVTITCKDYFNETLNRTEDIEDTLAACLNESMWRNYKLEASLSKVQYCKRANDKPNVDLGDFIVAAVYLVLIVLNITASLYDLIICENGDKKGNQYLLAFSIRRNWSKLVAPSGIGPDLRMKRLKVFNGLRTLTIICVIFSHTALILSSTYIANPFYIEKTYDDPSKQILYNGTLVTHTFFVMSGFLLAYNLQIFAEKSKLSWTQIPKGMLLRWIRLTPSYALTLATIATIMRHAGKGPLWDLIVVSESNFCRQYWWAHILYFNNYIYERDICFPQGWYLAADTQLFCLGLIFLVLVRKPLHRKIALMLLFPTSLAITAFQTYFLNLGPIVIQKPESYRTFYVKDNTFLLSYIATHSNISVYILGLVGGLLVHRWQTDEKDFSSYKKYGKVVWLLFPMGVGVILSGGFFYIDGATPPVLLQVAYATLYKSLFQSLILMFIIGAVFKLESFYRRMTEWRGFTWTGRVSYSAFLLHSLFQRALAGIQTGPVVFSDYYVLIILFATLFMSFISGAVLWIFVEAPVGALTKILLTPQKTKTDS